MNTNLVDKSTVGQTRPHYDVGVVEGQISDIVLMPGDPFRVQLIADRLDRVEEVAHKREYRTVTSYYKGRKITACSSGMGCPPITTGVRLSGKSRILMEQGGLDPEMVRTFHRTAVDVAFCTDSERAELHALFEDS